MSIYALAPGGDNISCLAPAEFKSLITTSASRGVICPSEFTSSGLTELCHEFSSEKCTKKSPPDTPSPDWFGGIGHTGSPSSGLPTASLTPFPDLNVKM